MTSLTDRQQEQIYKQTMNISAARKRSEVREEEMLHALLQRTELLYGILTRIEPNALPPDFSDLIFSTNQAIERAEAARAAGMRVFDMHPPPETDEPLVPEDEYYE